MAKKKKSVKKRTARKPAKKVKKTAKKKVLAKKKSKKATAKPSTKKRKGSSANIIGLVTHYFPHVNAAVVKVKKPFQVGDTVLIKGHTTNLEQKVESMQIDHVAIQVAKKGDEIGLQVSDRVRDGDLVERVQ